MKLLYISIIIFLTFSINGLSQNSKPKEFTLKQAQEYALTNNYIVKNAELDIEIAKKKIWETTAIGLPQANASISYQDMIKIPTQMMPDFLTPAVAGINMGYFGLTPIAPLPEAGSTFPVQFGTKHNASWDFTATQLVFNGAYLVGLQASRVYAQYAQQSFESKQATTKLNVTNSYYLVLMLEESKTILDSSYQLISKTASDIEEMNKQGYVEFTDVEQIKITASTLKNTLLSMERQIDIAKRLLKFQMGIDIDEPILLTEKLNNLLLQINLENTYPDSLNITSNIDYKIMETNVQLMKLNLNRNKTDLLPSIAGYYTFRKNTMQKEFEIFDFKKPWYPTSIIGLSVQIPIFGSGSKLSKIQQATLNYKQMLNAKEQVSDGLKLEYQQAKAELLSAIENYKTLKENYMLSKNIYQRTLVKYNEGVASSLELTTNQNQYLTTQSNYYTAIYKLLSAKARLDKVMNVL